MKINIISDLHLEFANYVHTVPEGTDVIILAGDVATGLDGVKWAGILSEEVKIPIIYVAGNHEFYAGNIFPNHYEDMREYCDNFNNLHFLQNDTLVLDGVRFLGATLWTDFNFTENQSRSMHVAPSYMNDYRQTYEMVGDRKTALTPKTVLDDHTNSMLYLTDAFMQKFDGPTVVVTHFGCAAGSIHPRFRGQMGNEYFTSRLEKFILDHQPEYWLHGHTHCPTDYNVGNTRVIANPRGYVRRYRDFEDVENKEFRKDFTIEV